MKNSSAVSFKTHHLSRDGNYFTGILGDSGRLWIKKLSQLARHGVQCAVYNGKNMHSS